jgi:hypothetical protein
MSRLPRQIDPFDLKIRSELPVQVNRLQRTLGVGHFATFFFAAAGFFFSGREQKCCVPDLTSKSQIGHLSVIP